MVISAEKAKGDLEAVSVCVCLSSRSVRLWVYLSLERGSFASGLLLWSVLYHCSHSYCTTILLYYFCSHCEYHCSYLTVCALICVFESTCHWKRGRVAPIAAYYCSYCNSSTYLQYCSHPILFALSIVSIVSILLPLIWERPGLLQLQCSHFREQKRENILPTPILAYNNMRE